MFNSDSSNDTTMFDYNDDSIDKSQVVEISGLRSEVEFYKKVRMTKEAKANCNIWQWWNTNRTSFPCLFTAAQSLLHIPATTIAAERLFSLAGYFVIERKSIILPENVNEFIFLNQNHLIHK